MPVLIVIIISNPTKADPNRPSARRSNISVRLMEWFIGSGMPHAPDFYISAKVASNTISINKNKTAQHNNITVP